MNNCFRELKIKIYPFKRPVEELLTDNWPEGRMDKLHSIDELNPELLSFFKDNNVDIRETFLLINWWTLKFRSPHTDGNWFSNEKIVQKRLCGINWSFTPGTWVEFYDTKDCVPYFSPTGSIDDATTWPTAKVVVDTWKTSGPVIFNPQVPHRVNSYPHVERRVSCTLRFFETYESLLEKLGKFI